MCLYLLSEDVVLGTLTRVYTQSTCCGLALCHQSKLKNNLSHKLTIFVGSLQNWLCLETDGPTDGLVGPCPLTIYWVMRWDTHQCIVHDTLHRLVNFSLTPIIWLPQSIVPFSWFPFILKWTEKTIQDGGWLSVGSHMPCSDTPSSPLKLWSGPRSSSITFVNYSL